MAGDQPKEQSVSTVKTPFPIIRRLSVFVTPVLLRLPVSANQVTAVSLVVGLGSAYAVTLGTYEGDVIAALLLLLCYILDNCDGEVARHKNQCSDFGMRFDSFVDWIVHAAFFACLGLGVERTTGEALWFWLGMAAAAGATINYAVGFIVEGINRRRDERDGRQSPTGHEAPEESAMPEIWYQWPVYFLRELSRADFCFIVLALALGGVTWVLLPLGAIGAQAYWMTQFVHGAGGYHV